MTRINFTGRQRIERSNVHLRLREVDGCPVLDVLDLKLDDLALPGDAVVIVEAYRETVIMRLAAGTVSALRLPTDTALSEFDSLEVIRFRVKVVGSGSDEGKLLAVADRMRAVSEEDDIPHSSLLPIVPEQMGQVLWRLDISDDEPRLLVNKEIGDWKGFSMSPQFTAFVVPEALRQITQWVIQRIDSYDAGDGSPLDLWVSFLVSLGHDPRDEQLYDDAERGEWIDDVVEHFSRRFRFRDLVADAWGGDE